MGGESEIGSYSSTGGGSSAPTCSNATSPPVQACEGGAEEAFACGPFRGGSNLQHGDDAVYLLSSGTGRILRFDKAEPGSATVVDTANGSAVNMLVDEPYVYWTGSGGIGRTGTAPGATGELLASPCFPTTTGDLVADSTSIYWSTYAPPFQSVTLRLDKDTSRPATSVLLQGETRGCFGADGARLYHWSPSVISALDKNARCSCECAEAASSSAGGAGGAPGDASGSSGNGTGGINGGGGFTSADVLSCQTSSGIGLNPGAGGTAGYYEDCGGQDVTVLYESPGAQIQGVVMDESHIYFSSYQTISRLTKDGQVSTILPAPEDAGYRAIIYDFALDATSVYAYRTVSLFPGGDNPRSEILRIAKDGSEVASLYERPNELVRAMAVDDTHIYMLVVDGAGECNFTLVRLPKALTPADAGPDAN